MNATGNGRRPRGASPDVHLNLNVRGLGQSATLAINEHCARLAREGRSIVRLGLGQSPFPVPDEVVEELRANAHRKDYLPVCGLRELQEAVARYHHRSQGLDVQGRDVLIGPGSKELMFILQLVHYGDLVIPTPSWVSYAPQAQIIGRRIRWVPTRPENGHRLTPDALDALCTEDPGRPRIVILNYPGNPTGDSYPADELRALAKVARRHRLVLLSDEIYGELHHRGRHVSIARFYPEGTVVSSGLSKWCGAGGWRLGTFAFPPQLRWLLDGMAAVASETFTSTSAPIQHAAVRAFVGGTGIENHLFHSRRVLRQLGRRLWRRLQECGASVTEPKGGFYLFPSFEPLRERLEARGAADGATLCERLLEETGVAALPGSAFGRPPEELSLRLAYVDFDGARALMLSRQTPPDEELPKDLPETLAPAMLAGVERLCEWAAARL